MSSNLDVSSEKSKLAVKNFKTVHSFFIRQGGMNSNDPYQDICDNYSDFMNRMSDYERNFTVEKDNMFTASNVVLILLRRCFDNCYSWSSGDFFKHFRVVNSAMYQWTKILETDGYNFE